MILSHNWARIFELSYSLTSKLSVKRYFSLKLLFIYIFFSINWTLWIIFLYFKHFPIIFNWTSPTLQIHRISARKHLWLLQCFDLDCYEQELLSCIFHWVYVIDLMVAFSLLLKGFEYRYSCTDIRVIGLLANGWSE